MSLDTLKIKVEQLIEKVRSGGSATPSSPPWIDTSTMTNFNYWCEGGCRLDTLAYIDTSSGTSFAGFFSLDGVHSEFPVEYLDTSKGLTFASFFKACTKMKKAPFFDTSAATNLYEMFATCSTLEEVPQYDTGNVFNFSSMFSNCRALKSVPMLDMNRATNAASMFSNCTALETVSLTSMKDGSGYASTTFNKCAALTNVTVCAGFKSSLYLQHSTQYTQETLHAIIDNLADMTGATKAPVFQIGSTNLAKISEEYIAKLNAKKWSYS